MGEEKVVGGLRRSNDGRLKVAYIRTNRTKVAANVLIF